MQNGHNGKSGFYLEFICWGKNYVIYSIYFVFWDTYFAGNASYLCIAV